ncbi:MAG: endonuclease/exonuclease/phosphatase family protein, partial [Candidatus Hydrogenedentales bacterium]
AMGPDAHVYPPPPLPPEIRDRIAERLVNEAQVPMAMCARGDDAAHVWTEDGEFELPRDAAAVLGEDHPYQAAAADDLVRLTRHPNSGDLILLGWRLRGAPVSFPRENGAHAGPGAMETRPFLLCAADTWLPSPQDRPLRPVDLREAALYILGRSGDAPVPAVRRPREMRETTLRVMTYNVHSCIGMDGRCSPERIARVIAQYDPDVVCLQELDVRRPRTNSVDQAHQIAHHLEMLFHFHPAIALAEEQYGDAILSRHHIELVKAAGLPGLHMEDERHEPRGALWVRVKVNGRTFNILNTHLSLNRQERLMATEALLGPEWLGHPECNHGLRILCGDFNASPRSPVCRRFGQCMCDCQVGRDRYRPRNTFFGRMPLARIDHIFVDAAADILHVEVPTTKFTRLASDHLPLIVDLAV